jgi:hypothetical protein
LILATAVSTSDMDMGMGMQMKTSNVASNKLLILGRSCSYKISNTLTKLKSDMDFMGQQTNYDSEKPADNESETGKAVASSKARHISAGQTNREGYQIKIGRKYARCKQG